MFSKKRELTLKNINQNKCIILRTIVCILCLSLELLYWNIPMFRTIVLDYAYV